MNPVLADQAHSVAPGNTRRGIRSLIKGLDWYHIDRVSQLAAPAKLHIARQCAKRIKNPSRIAFHQCQPGIGSELSKHNEQHSGFTMNTSVGISLRMLTALALAIAIPVATAADSVQGRQGRQGGMMQGQGGVEAQKQNRHRYEHQNRYRDNGSSRSGYDSGQQSRGTSATWSSGHQGTSGGPGYGQSKGYGGKQGNAQGSVGNRGGGQGGGRGR
jgi:hypothetical protein